MIKKREGWRRTYPEPAASRMKNNQCPGCAKPKTEWTRRKDWMCCSTECSEEFFSKTCVMSWDVIRKQALKRDGNKCVKCGLAPKKKYPGWKRNLETGQIEKYYFDTDDLDLAVDHIKPIALGGDEFHLNNCQTLCSVCHKIKTKQDIKKIAERRYAEKKQKVNKTLI